MAKKEKYPMINLLKNTLGPLMVMQQTIKMMQSKPFQIGYETGYHDAKEGKDKMDFRKLEVKKNG